MYSIQRLIQFQLYSPALYSSVRWRPYGILFRNPLNVACYDANHGVILDLSCDLPAALEDLERFYRARCLPPRIHGGFLEGEKEALFPALQARGYRIEEPEETALLLSAPCALPEGPGFFIEHPRSLTMEFSALLVSGIGPWALEMTEALLCRRGCRAYALRTRDGTLSAYGMVVRTDDCSYLQNVFTLPAYRRQGFCSALLRHITAEHRAEYPGLPLYLTTTSEDALRLYEQAGFRPVEHPFPAWSASLPDES